MREIKFRVWDGSQMILPTEIYGDIRDEYAMSLSGVLMYFVESGNGNYCPSTLEARFKRDFIVMQFTGLHDKSNNPIYEGDILKTPALVVPGYSLGIVEFNVDTCCYIKRYDKKAFVRMDVRKDEVEVVTNIYEADKLKHPDRSCSLEAQGYNEEECKEIGDRDYLADKCIELMKKVYESPLIKIT